MQNVITNLKKKHKDEIKADIKNELDRQDILDKVQLTLQRILEKPTLWLHPDFKLIRSHISAIGKDRVRFPLLDETKVIGSIDTITDSTMELSADFVTGVYNRTICSEEDYSDHPIVLQIFSPIGCRHRNYFCSVKKQSIVVNHVSFVVVDSTGNLLSVKLAS